MPELQETGIRCQVLCECKEFQGLGLYLHTHLITSKTMMPPIDLGATHSANKFKFCFMCDTTKPPEGGIEIGTKWNCQACWLKRITGSNLKQNRINGGAK